MDLDAYSVAVRISLVEDVTRGLVMMGRYFATTDAQAKALEDRLKSIGKQAMVGAGLMAGGAFGLHMLKGPIEEAKKYQIELARFSALGFGSKIDAQADAFARGMKTIGTSARDNMALVGDAMAVFKNLGHAEMAAPVMAKMKFANETLFGQGPEAASDRKLMDMMKVIEFRGGLSSDKEFQTQADFAQKAIVGSRGRVDPTALLQALKTGGVALSHRSNDAFYLGGEPLIQEFGGSRYGTAAMSIYQNLVQARSSKTAQAELYRLGLLDRNGVEFNSQGAIKRAKPGSFKGSSILENEGELALLQKVLLPAFAKNGVTGDEAVIRELGMILSNRTGSALLSRIYQQHEAGSLDNQISANRHAQGVNAAAKTAAGTAQGQIIDLEKKEADLKLQIGQAILPMYIKALEKTRDLLVGITAFATKNPAAFKAIIGTFAAVSAAAVASGGLIMLSAGFRALALLSPVLTGFGGLLIRLAPIAMTVLTDLATGLAIFASDAIALVVAMGPVGWTLMAVGAAAAYVYTHWAQLKPMLDQFTNWISGLVNKLGALHPLDAIEHTLGFGNTVKPASAAPSAPPHVYMDGKKVGEIVTKHQNSAAGRPNTGTTGFNPLYARPSVAGR